MMTFYEGVGNQMLWVGHHNSWMKDKNTQQLMPPGRKRGDNRHKISTRPQREDRIEELTILEDCRKLSGDFGDNCPPQPSSREKLLKSLRSETSDQSIKVLLSLNSTSHLLATSEQILRIDFTSVQVVGHF